MNPIFRSSSGVTLIELLVTMVILSILATCILPLSQITHKRAKEIELKRNLRAIRNALDEFYRLSEEEKIPRKAFGSGYPESLEILVTGVELQGPVPQYKKFLRRIPKDPMTEEGEWGLRSYFDEPDSDIWGGQDVYDVYSMNDEEALDGTLYKDW